MEEEGVEIGIRGIVRNNSGLNILEKAKQDEIMALWITDCGKRSKGDSIIKSQDNPPVFHSGTC